MKVIEVPLELLKERGNYGGVIRMGDLSGDGEVDFLVYRSIDNAHDGGGLRGYRGNLFFSKTRKKFSTG